MTSPYAKEPNQKHSGLRLRVFRKQKGLSCRALAKSLGVPDYKIYDIERGKQRINEELILPIAKILDIHVETLLGQDESETKMVWVKHYNIEASAGSGSFLNQEHLENGFGFSTSYLRALGLSANQLSLISVRGISMEPVFYDKDILLINHEVQKLVSTKPFVFRFDDELYVKYLQKLPSGNILVVSENSKNFPSYQIDIDLLKTERFKLIGQVASSLHAW